MKRIEISRKAETELDRLGVFDWPVWTCDVSEFPWKYDDRESCYVIEGEVEITTDTETVYLRPGDYAVFPAGLQCRWKVIKPVKKHYKLG
ncbi:MAG: cupin domain-containing protein [FCB group bacterium]|nr:cupin domain-containing protein [FCB group bacterium]